MMLAWSMARVAGPAYAMSRGTAIVSVKRRAIHSVEQGASHLQRRPSVSLHYACREGKNAEKIQNYSNFAQSNEGISCPCTYHQIVTHQ
jgi:hypothetical protein